jgi:hypothetical protein
MEISTDTESLPKLNEFHIFNTDRDNDVLTEFVVAECYCGNQWRLKNYSSIVDIHLAYEESYLGRKEHMSKKEIKKLLEEIKIG